MTEAPANGVPKKSPVFPCPVDEQPDGTFVDCLGGRYDADGNSLDRPTIAMPERPPPAPGPLAGLRALESIALVGGAAIREAAARPVVWVWQLYVVAGQIVVIFGAPGSGKTTLLCLLVIARANGVAVEVLGRRVEPAPRGKYIVFIQAEQEEGAAARKLTKSVEILGLDAVDSDPLDRVILLARKEVRIDNEKWREVRKLFERGLVSDLFADSLGRLARADANSEQEQIAVFAELGEAIESAPANDAKPLVWLNAHGRKDADGTIDSLSGSTQRAAQADTMLFVKATRDDADKVISSRVTAPKIRDEGDDHPGAVDFAIVKDDGGKWTCKLGAGASAKKEDQPAHERVYALLGGGPKTKNEIRDELANLSGDRVEKAISTLFAEKRIKKTKKRVRGVERDAFARRERREEGGFRFATAHRRKRSDVDRPRAAEAGAGGAGEEGSTP